MQEKKTCAEKHVTLSGNLYNQSMNQ